VQATTSPVAPSADRRSPWWGVGRVRQPSASPTSMLGRGFPILGPLARGFYRQCIVVVLTAWLAPSTFAAAAVEAAEKVRWEEWWQAQSQIRTWQAEFVQVRTLATVSVPLETTGRVWYQAPDFFRWELGEPAKTIALRSSNTVWIIYPKLKRAERYGLGAGGGSAWAQLSALFEAGFPQSKADLEKRFRPISMTRSNELSLLLLAPRAASARRFLPELRLGLAGDPPTLLLTLLRLSDGSTMENRFQRQTVNTGLPPSVLEFPSLEGYAIRAAGAATSVP